MRREQWILYRMLDDNGKVLYVGQTVQLLKKRIRQHFGPKGYIKPVLHQVARVEFAHVPNDADLNLYEAYYIGLENPPINGLLKTVDRPTITLEPLVFEEFREWYAMKQCFVDAECKRKKAKEKENERLAGELTPDWD